MPQLDLHLVPQFTSRPPPACTPSSNISSINGHSPATHPVCPGELISTQWRHRVGQAPSRQCKQCDNPQCSAARCPVCREEADTPKHVVLRCPALMSTRYKLLGCLYPEMEDVRSADVVAALGAAYRDFLSRTATP